MDSSLKGRAAIITGASKGLGRVMAPVFAEAGCRVAVHYFSNEENAKDVVKNIKEAGGEAFAVKADISNASQVKSLFEAATSRYGTVDILVNNARVDPYKRPAGLSEGEWFDRVIGVSLKGAYLCTLEAFRIMKEQRWGRILNVSSVHSQAASPLFLVPYGISKIGMLNITRSFATAGAEFGITVNTLAPGLIITETLEERITAEEIDAQKASIPLKRGATTREVAEAALFCVQAAFMTGETLNLNGGVFMP
ncbi:MAG TPA: SDR family NAD(P)-dependent oxidoreductase [Spirochaetia bacterium]|nr:SDR family NAD(P)-dependent oxidoreductase [Spirochaetia bacterium]